MRVNPRTKSPGRPKTPTTAPEGLLAQRAIALGRTASPERLADATLSRPLGVLLARGLISRQEYRAGEELERLWRTWAAMASAPPRSHIVRDGRGSGGDPDAERWRAVNTEYMTIRRAVMRDVKSSALAWSMLESLTMDAILPPRLLSQPNWAGWIVLQDALEVLARHFRIPASL